MSNTETTVELRELGYVVVYSNYENVALNFRLYAIECEDEDGNVLFHEDAQDSWPSPVRDISKAELFAHGDVKWDGCSNWSFDASERVMFHQCTRKGLEDFGKLLTTCWDIAKKELNGFRGD